MKWLLDANGNIVTRNGMPVLVRDDGTEMEFDGPGALNKITALNKEAEKTRLELKTTKEALEKFGDANPEDIEGFLTTLEELGGPEGIAKLKAGGNVNVEELKTQIKSGYEQQIAKLTDKHTKALAEKDGHIYKLEVGNRFATSAFIAEKLIIPPDMAESTFSKNFKVEDGRMIAYDHNGEKLWSQQKPGELAEFDEAIELIVGSYQYKDKILKGANQQGNETKQTHQNRQTQQNTNLSPTQKIAEGLKALQ